MRSRWVILDTQSLCRNKKGQLGGRVGQPTDQGRLSEFIADLSCAPGRSRLVPIDTSSFRPIAFAIQSPLVGYRYIFHIIVDNTRCRGSPARITTIILAPITESCHMGSREKPRHPVQPDGRVTPSQLEKR